MKFTINGCALIILIKGEPLKFENTTDGYRQMAQAFCESRGIVL